MLSDRLSDRLAIGAEWRAKPDNLRVFKEDAGGRCLPRLVSAPAFRRDACLGAPGLDRGEAAAGWAYLSLQLLL